MKPARAALQRWITSAIVLAFTTGSLAAAEGANPAEKSAEAVFKWIHFAILVVVLLWLFKKVLPPYVRRNADEISAEITKAAAAKAAAEKQLKEAAAKLTTLEQEVARFREQAQKEAAAELERLRGMTTMDIKKLSVAAKAEIDAAERAAREVLKALAAKLAVDRAQSLVAGEMTPAVQDAMISNFVQSLQGRPN
ncbi:MAG: ATP synthase F0 subunit B [Candidatus Acidiferrum sp.]